MAKRLISQSKNESKLEPQYLKTQKLKTEIETLKRELVKLIDLGASFNEIYSMSVKLDKLIVSFYKCNLSESV